MRLKVCAAILPALQYLECDFIAEGNRTESGLQFENQVHISVFPALPCSSEVILTGRYHASRACGSAETTCIDPPKVEAFEYRELADATSRLENTFGDLTSVSRLWFSVEGEEAETLKSTEKSRRGGQAMFGDWRIDESLVDVFENQTGSTRFGKQVHRAKQAGNV